MTIKRLKCDLSPEITTCLKLRENNRFDCCPIRNRIPYDAQCFLGDIAKELKKLQQRHDHHFTKQQRIMELAIPRVCRRRFVPKCPCQFKKTIQMVSADQPANTRTEQLALPTVRRLLYRREHAIDVGDTIGESILNRWLRFSYMSLYSRLCNVQPMQKPKKKKKQSAKDKKKHSQYISKLAKPKVPLEPPEPERKAGEVNARRLKKLSRPKMFIEDQKPAWELTPGLKTYKPSDRIKAIAEPIKRANVHTNPEPEKVSPNALRYKPSERIKEMSQPLAKNEANQGAGDVGDDPFAISPNALKYKPSSRIKELAEPKEFENVHIRENPFAISPAALKARASPRLIELAKPKGS
ncbi:hypothetical protein KR222_004337 [Zaprionus bogoriensis]|nr:hypothetical protein KR222_004337 [Zaprionus bogoriensis]